MRFARGGWTCALLFAVACTSARKDPPVPPPECAPGGDFVVGAPLVLEGSCSGHFPQGRELSIEPIGARSYAVTYAGARLLGDTNDECLLVTERLRQQVLGHDTALRLQLSTSGPRVAAEVEMRIHDLPAGESCDVRFRLVGRLAPDNPGNPTGDTCGTAATCVGELCAFAGVSACAFETCLYQRTPEAELSYCTEPCEPGSCPFGFDCLVVDPWVYGSEEDRFCVLHVPICGDGLIEGDEACDDGDRDSGDGCSAACDSDESCGNGITDVGETCDDGGTSDGGGCNALCEIEICGNGVTDFGETCDFGDTIAGDGCSSHCRLEACGNGALDLGEACDDGNDSDVDGCDTDCKIRLSSGAARVDSRFSDAERTDVGQVFAVSLGGAVVYAWSEAYAGAPFGAEREIYVARLDPTTLAVSPPRRVTLAQGRELAGLAATSQGELVLIAHDGAALVQLRSQDGGQSFPEAAPLTLSGVPAHDDAGAFAYLTDDGTRLFLFAGLHLPAVSPLNRNLYFTRSLDGGATWEPAVRLSSAADASGWASRPVVRQSGAGELTVAFADGQLEAGDVYVARSLDHGATWLTPTPPLGAHAAGRLDTTAASLASGNGFVYVGWLGATAVMVSRYTLSTGAWLSTEVASYAELGEVPRALSLVAGNGAALHVALHVRDHTLVTRSLDSAGTFATPRRVARQADGLALQGVSGLALAADLSLGATTSDRLILLAMADAGPHALESRDGGARYSAQVTALGEPAAASAPPRFASLVHDGRTYVWAASGAALHLFDMLGLELAGPATPAAGTPGSGCDDLPLGGWCQPSTVGAPAPRSGATAVVAGDEVLVFGGWDGFAHLDDGGAYDAVADSWRALPALPAGFGRVGHSATYSEGELIVFGGFNGLAALGDGLAYARASNSWRRLPSSGAPTPRHLHGAALAGSAVVLFGGMGPNGRLADGGRYDPLSDSWTSFAHSGVVGVSSPALAVAGDELFVIGGFAAMATPTSQAFRVDLSSGDATPLPATNAPSARGEAAAVFVPGMGLAGAVLVWGGIGSDGPLSDGARFDLASGAWQPLSATGAPSPRLDPVVVASPSEWLVFGGSAAGGASFDFQSGTWSPLPLAGAPPSRRDASAVWHAGTSRFVVFYGSDASGPTSTGGLLVR